MNSSPLEPRSPREPAQPQLVPAYDARPPRRDYSDAEQMGSLDLWFISDFRNILRRRWPLLLAPAILLAGAVLVYCAMSKPIYEADAAVMLESRQSGSSLSSMLGSASPLAGLLGGSSGGEDLPAQIQIMTSDEVLNRVSNRLNLHETPLQLRRDIKITQDKNGGPVLDISVRDYSPKTAQRIASTLVDVYEESVGDENATVLGHSATLIRRQIADTHAQLSLAEDRLAGYSRASGSIAPDAESTGRATMLLGLRSDYMTAQQKVAAAAAERDYWRSQITNLPSAVVPSLSLARNPVIENDTQQLNSLEAERARLATEYTPRDAEMVANAEKIAALKQQIADALKAQDNAYMSSATGSVSSQPVSGYIVSGATRELNPLRETARQNFVEAEARMQSEQADASAVQATLAQARAQMSSVPAGLRRYADLKDDVEVERKIYDALRVQLNDLEAQRTTEQVYVRLLEPAMLPKSPAFPKPILYGIAAGLFGLLLGALAMIGAESGDKRLRNMQDVNTELGARVLGILPRLGLRRGAGAGQVFDNSLPAPEMRRIASTLVYLGLGRTFHSLLVTSAVPGEGVSLTASGIGVALAKEGKRVIIVDANLRSPSLHTYFGLENSSGLAGVMRNGAQPEKALVPLEGLRPLQLVPGGDLQDESVGQTLDEGKMATILDALRDRADVVLLDAPAILDGFETAMLADKVDATLMVTAMRRAERDDVRHALELLSTCKAPLLGLVLNESVPSAKRPTR